MSQARTFLEALFSGKPDELYVLLWTLPEKESRWFRLVEEAVRCAGRFQDHDLYAGVGLARNDFGSTRRCPSEEVAGIIGMWADLDLRSNAHPKESLPGSIEQAVSILPPEFPPTLVILTGNGVHVWWLFREPWVFESDEDRREAAALVARWHTLLRDNASQRGWTYERLADFARVLRVPGTKNFKDPSNPKPVVIHTQSDRRYNPSELGEYLDDLDVPDCEAQERAAQEWAQRFQNNPIIINLAARVPEAKLNQWLEADMRFKNTWFRQRHDLRDQSQSGYDLALACFGFRAGLTEQEIVELITHHRALHKQKQRTRLDYFQRTLSRAANHSAEATPVILTSNSPEVAESSKSNLSAASSGDEASRYQPSSEASGDAQRGKIELCHRISTVLGVEILRLIRLTGKEPLYRMDLPEGKIEFQNVGKLISQGAVRTAIAAKVGKLLPHMKTKLWEQLAQMMLDACTDEQGGEELEYEGAARMHINQYLSETTFVPSIEGQIAQELRRPMVRDGRITVCASDLQMYINKTTQQNLPVRAVAAMLAAIGATTVRVRGRKIKEQSRWELPLEQFDPGDYSVSEREDSVEQHE